MGQQQFLDGGNSRGGNSSATTWGSDVWFGTGLMTGLEGTLGAANFAPANLSAGETYYLPLILK